MPQFNVAPNPNQPTNFGGMSEGIRTSSNTALGSLFENLSNTLDKGIKETDRNVQKNIQNDAYEAADQVYNEFGVGDKTLIDSDANNKAATPQAIEMAGKSLDSLQTAFTNGNVAEGHYWARMNSVVRQLRAKYPGYREQIDSMVSGITGQTPANALRNSIFSEMNSNASSADKWNTFVNSHLADLPPDYFDNPNKYTPTEVRSYIATRLRDKANTESARADIALSMDQDKVVGDQAKKQFSVESNQFVNRVLQDTTSAAGKDWAQLNTTMTRMRTSMESNSPVAKEDIEQSRVLIGRLMQETQLALHQKFTEQWDDDPRHSYMANVDPKDRDAIIQEAMTPLNVAMQSLDAKNPAGLLGALAGWIQTTKDSNTADLLKDVPFAGVMQSMNDTLGPDVASAWMLTAGQGSTLAAATASLANYAKMKMAMGQGTVTQDVQQMLSKGQKGSDTQSLIQNWQDALSKLDQMPLSVRKNAIKYMFDDSTHAQLASTLDNDSQLEWLNKVASPAVTAQLVKMKKEDSDSWNLYQTWVAKEFQRQFYNTMADVNVAFTNPDKFDIKWNNSTAQFDFKVKDVGAPGNIFGDLKYGSIKGIKDLNRELQIIKPILQANGEADMGREVMDLLQGMGFDPEATRPQGVGTSLWDAIKKNLSKDPFGRDEEVKKDNNNG